MTLSPKQLFCLQQIAERDVSTLPVCNAAQQHPEFPRVRYSMEWADAPFRELRNKGLIEKTGEKDGTKRSVHRITDSGREILKGLSDA
jgi:hypothetical protein